MMNNWTNMIDAILSQAQTEFNGLGQWQSYAKGQAPLVNIYVEGDQAVVTAEIPGMDKADLNLEVKDDQLRIQGKRLVEKKEGQEVYHRERASLEFDRTVTLPFKADPEQVKASYDLGVLTVELTHAEEDRPKKIEIH